jgi:hypothetical protein
MFGKLKNVIMLGMSPGLMPLKLIIDGIVPAKLITDGIFAIILITDGIGGLMLIIDGTPGIMLITLGITGVKLIILGMFNGLKLINDGILTGPKDTILGMLIFMLGTLI